MLGGYAHLFRRPDLVSHVDRRSRVVAYTDSSQAWSYLVLRHKTLYVSRDLLLDLIRDRCAVEQLCPTISFGLVVLCCLHECPLRNVVRVVKGKFIGLRLHRECLNSLATPGTVMACFWFMRA